MAHTSPQRQHGHIVLGVDASRNRSGGAIAHIKGLVDGADPRDHGIQHVHLFGHEALLAQVREYPWLTKHLVAATKGSIFGQLLWQRFRLPRIARQLGIAVMFNTDAGSVCPFQPSVTLSQDMLSYEPGEIERYPWPSRARVRLEILKFVQLARLRNSTVSLFLTQHAAKVIGSHVKLKEIEVIPHGIDPKFFVGRQEASGSYLSDPINITYVSNTAPYKHQWHVVEGVAIARKRSGRDLRLRLIGGGAGAAQERLSKAIAVNDPNKVFVEQTPFIPNDKIVTELHVADMFVFASSCENMPITLLEAMAAGLPIACSDRGPMPEILGSVNPYFDPERPETIADAIERLITDDSLRNQASSTAVETARNFTWERCATAAWKILGRVARA